MVSESPTGSSLGFLPRKKIQNRYGKLNFSYKFVKTLDLPEQILVTYFAINYNKFIGVSYDDIYKKLQLPVVYPKTILIKNLVIREPVKNYYISNYTFETVDSYVRNINILLLDYLSLEAKMQHIFLQSMVHPSLKQMWIPDGLYPPIHSELFRYKLVKEELKGLTIYGGDIYGL